MKNILLLFSALLLTFSNCADSSFSLYISQAGNDSNPGTIDAPLATIEKAQQIIKDYAGKKTVNVYFREGTYYITKPIEHTYTNSGTKEHPIIYSNYKDEKVTLSTSVLLKNLKWEKRDDTGIYLTVVDQDLSVFDQLFVNGQKQHMARYPDYDPTIANFNGYSADAISEEKVGSWKNPAGGILHAMHKHDWGGYHYQIKGKDEKGELILEGGWQNNRQMGMHDKYRMVENIFEELDAENEWFYDKNTNVLYYYPPADMDLNSAQFEVPQLESIFVIKGTEEQPAGNIHIKGLELTHTTFTFMKTKEPLLRSDWTIYRGGVIFIEGAENCIVSDCHIYDAGGNGIFFSNYNKDNRAEKNHIHDIGASGICFVGSPEAVRSPSFEYSKYIAYENLDLTTGPANNNYPSACTADNNLIHDIGKIEKQIAGIQISMSKNITVSHNSIYNLPRAGINISEGTWGGHIIEWNDVFDTVLETGDHGSFNSWGRDRFWFANRRLMDSIVATYPDLISLDAIETTIIRNNRWRCDHGWDIDLDDGSSNYHIYNNLCLNGGLKLREGFNRTIENNIMVNNSFHPHVWFKNSRDIFRHNIVTRNYFPIAVNYWGKEIDYNLFPDSSSLLKAQSEGIDKHSVAGNPLFINPAIGDYRVRESSPAFEIGFKNFEMDKFGVVYEKLKKITKTPTLPLFIIVEQNEDIKLYKWMRAEFKDMTSEGERSATGMSRIAGIIVISIDNGSPLKKAGLQTNDVILAVNRKNTDKWADFARETSTVQKGTSMQIRIFRDQREYTIPFTVE